MADAPLTLGFDTSGPSCAALLLQGDTVLAQAQEALERGQAERLIPMCEALLAEAGIGWGDLDRIGVGTGPGNFTGVRIAVAAARGLSLGLGIPAVGVTLFDAAALDAPRPLIVAHAAPRGAVYAAGYGLARALAPAETEISALRAHLEPGVALVGSAAEAVAAAFDLPVLPAVHAPAAAIARIAAMATDTPPAAPFYLRGADAAPPREAPPRILP